MLSQHPDVFWAGEVFEPFMKTKNAGTPCIAQNTIEDACHSRVSRVFGFETKYLRTQHLCRQCANMRLDEYVALLRRIGFRKFVVLHRANYLRRAISVEVARIRNQWHTQRTVTNATKLVLDTQKFQTGVGLASLVDSFNSIDTEYSKLCRLLSREETAFLFYEKDIQNDPRMGYQRVVEFLGIKDVPTTVTLRRTNPFAIKEVVKNLEEVSAVLGDSKFSWMLDDER
jgi:hypothetical protein